MSEGVSEAVSEDTIFRLERLRRACDYHSRCGLGVKIGKTGQIIQSCIVCIFSFSSFAAPAVNGERLIMQDK